MATIHNILASIARTLFAMAWAEQADENNVSIRGEIFDQIPRSIDPSAVKAAKTLAMDIERVAGLSLDEVYKKFSGGLSEEDWGHYVAMSSLGAGVGLWEYVPREKLNIPYMDFGPYCLEKDYFGAGF